MSVAELGYSPVITPRTLQALDGRVSTESRDALIALSRKSIQMVFKPFMDHTPKQLAAAFEESQAQFQTFRISLNLALFQLLERDALLKWSSNLVHEFSEAMAEACKRLGLNPRTMKRVLNSYGLHSRILLESRNAFAHGLFPPGTPRFRHLNGLFAVATRLDFAMTALFLAFDREIESTPPVARFLLSEATAATDDYRKHIQGLSEPMLGPEEQWLGDLQSQGLWLGWRPTPASRPAGVWVPIQSSGKPLSDTIVENRR